MSRTVHHVVYNYRESTLARDRELRRITDSGVHVWVSWHQLHNPMEWHSLTDLRYSAAALAEAAREGRRPRPQRLRHRLAAYTYPRATGARLVARISNLQERSLRAADRAMGQRARQVLRGSQDAVEAAWDLDFPDPRHRHFAVWDSW